jgi:hypothetical protein
LAVGVRNLQRRQTFIAKLDLFPVGLGLGRRKPAEVLCDRVHDQEAGLCAGRRIEQRIIEFEWVLAALTDAKLQNIANIRLDFPMAVDVT